MNINKIKGMTLLTLSFGVMLTGGLVNEASNDEGYSVAPISNSPLQDPDFPSYFRLNWKSEATGDIGLKIENNSTEDVVYNITFNRGITNLNGATVYDESRFNDSGPSPHITSMLEIPSEVKVKAKSSEVVTGKFKMPKESFKGSRVGGVTVSKKAEEATGSVEMAFNYAYPFIVIGDNFEPVSKDITFGKFELVEDESALYLKTPFDNENATFFRLQELDISLKDEEGNEVFGYNLPELLVTDSTNVPLSTQVNEELSSGKYTATIQMKYNDEILASEEQTFTYEKTKGFDNSPTVRGKSSNNESDNNMMIIGGIIIAILIIIVIALIIKNKKKDNTPTEDTKNGDPETIEELKDEVVVVTPVGTDDKSTESTVIESEDEEDIEMTNTEEDQVEPSIVDESEVPVEEVKITEEVEATPSEDAIEVTKEEEVRED